MMSIPKVSICVPVYKVEHLISRCLNSLVNQTLEDIEIIIVDDCSPDNSMAIVQEYAQTDNRIIVLTHETNRGLMVARRTGYMAARGEYIMFCDSDDSMVENAAETLYSAAVESNADIVSSNLTHIDIAGKKKVYKSEVKYGSDKLSIFKSLLLDEMWHNLWGKIYKRDLLQNYSYTTYENFTNGEDACLFYQLVDNSSKVIHIDTCLYNYFQNIASSTNAKLSNKAIESIVLVNKTRVGICGKYSALNDIIDRRVVISFSELCRLGYKKPLYEFATIHGMQDYLSPIKYISFFSVKDMIVVLVKRYLLR